RNRMRVKASLLVSLLSVAVVATVFAPSPTRAQTGSAAAFDASVARPMKADDLKKHLDAGETVVIVDGRSELDGMIVKGAVQVTEEGLVAWSDSASKTAPLVFYCTCDDDGIAIADVLGMQNLGFTNAYYLQGGLEA